MLFDTWTYWVFLLFVLLAAQWLRDRTRLLLLLVASYVFYAAWDPRFVLLLVASSLLNQGLGLAIHHASAAARRRWLTLAVAANLGILGFFKYYDFFIAEFAQLFSLDPSGVVLNVVLPVGVSFFTFEGIAYCVDVYRRDLEATRDWLAFALFMAFFPHLVAGPIIRPRDFLPQLHAPAAVDETALRWSLAQIIKGLIKKMVIADALAPIADAAFAATPAAGAPPAWAGVLAFSLQIYCDFAGYTDIARGSARLLGFEFPSNFERPYLARNIALFWRQWHISLSTWLRDYLYIALGGNRLGEARTLRNLLLVMALGGLWHGASWNFLIWGLLHGGMLIGQRVTAGMRPLPAWIAVPLTFLWVSLAWIPFRAPDATTALRVLTDLPLGFTVEAFRAWRGVLWVALGLGLFCFADRGRRVQVWLIERARPWQAGAAAGVSLWLLALFARTDANVPFIYFQF
jgi:alginate O-acetyltransferase complex protein AlgI